ncbi:MAG: type II toxin-antitoxin system mRNA interferase toxin, RelE/StbE family [Patescibacteria group bacterium]
MKISYHPKFKKAFKKRIFPDRKLREKALFRIKLFEENSSHPILKDHKLKGEKQRLRSFWITGDIRIVYKIKNDIATFLDIGSHNQVY